MGRARACEFRTVGAPLALLLVVLVPAVARAQQPDSEFDRVELGGTSDVTNERFEQHEDPSQNATSLYASLDLRRGF